MNNTASNRICFGTGIALALAGTVPAGIGMVQMTIACYPHGMAMQLAGTAVSIVGISIIAIGSIIKGEQNRTRPVDQITSQEA